MANEQSSIVFFNVLTRIVSQIKTHIDLTGEGQCPGVKDDHIVLWSGPVVQDDDIRDVHNTPGVVISPGRVVKVPPEGGHNRGDDVYYFVSVQIVDRSSSRFNADQLKCWLKWQQNIRAYFSSNNMRNEIGDEHGHLLIVTTPEINPLDDKLFYVSSNCVGAIAVEVKVREPRNTEGFR